MYTEFMSIELKARVIDCFGNALSVQTSGQRHCLTAAHLPSPCTLSPRVWTEVGYWVALSAGAKVQRCREARDGWGAGAPGEALGHLGRKRREQRSRSQKAEKTTDAQPFLGLIISSEPGTGLTEHLPAQGALSHPKSRRLLSPTSSLQMEKGS